MNILNRILTLDSGPKFGRFIRSGAIAGLVSTLVFTILHQILIANIWFSFPFMAVAGIVCGICLGGSYKLLFNSPNIISWFKYNSIYILMFFLLAVSSILYFDPITTTAEVMSRNVRPDDLIEKALPMSSVFTISFAVIISLLYGRRIIHYLAIFITSTILMVTLGLNVSIIGLVEIPSNSFYLLGELFGLIFSIILAFAIVLVFLERQNFFSKKTL